MSIFEYNEEEELKKLRAAEYQVGVDAGIAQGKSKGIAEAILELLGDKGDPGEVLRARILQETDLGPISAIM